MGSSQGTAYSQETILYNEQPNPINGDTLKEIFHRSLVAITFLNKYKKPGVGSGVLISEDTILTAAHNIFDRRLKAENINFKIYIGADGEAEDYQELKAWKYPEQFKKCKPADRLSFDYAIGILKKPKKFRRYLALSIACPQCLLIDNNRIVLQLFGFPFTYPEGHQFYGLPFKGNFMPIDPHDKYSEKIKLNQYGLARRNRIIEVNNLGFKISYGISTLPGQSGSPLVFGNTIIAIHAGGEISKEFNVGRKIDVTLLINIMKWGQQLRVSPFNIEKLKLCNHNQAENLKQILNRDYKQQMKERKLYIHNRGLKSMDLNEYGHLLELHLYSNKLRQIDVSFCPKLLILSLGNNQLRTINVSNNRYLIRLYLWMNQLQKIDVNANIDLDMLNLSSNKLTSIDTTKNTKLKRLFLDENMLTRVCLFISKNVDEQTYNGNNFINNYYFNFSDQQADYCQVQLKCIPQTYSKALRIAEKWIKRYEPLFTLFSEFKYSFKVV